MSRVALVPSLLLTVACGGRPIAVGDFELRMDPKTGRLTLDDPARETSLDGLAFHVGDGSADVSMLFGSFLTENVTLDISELTEVGRATGEKSGAPVWELTDADGERLAVVQAAAVSRDELILDVMPEAGNRVGLSADCAEDEHFMGLGSHAMDVDHVGQKFPLWVTEPGIGKEDDEDTPAVWAVTGTRHASSLPQPWLMRPASNQGILLDTPARVDVDLCATDPTRFSAVAWADAPLRISWITGDSPLDVVQNFTDHTGRRPLSAPWVFGPWNDAIRGIDEVKRVVERLREFDASATVVWSEDFKGGEQLPVGYHPSASWIVDRELYPEPEQFSAWLAGLGFKWFGYFSPFVAMESPHWEEAVSTGALIQDADGEPYVFLGARQEQTSWIDVHSEAGQAFAIDKMTDALDSGFSGWMLDYAEWLPFDAVVNGGMIDPWLAHNDVPQQWQRIANAAIGDRDATYFARSGWTDAGALAPVIWAGDQRTSFDADDGMPTVIALGLGAAVGGVPVFTHDIGGYQSVGNAPTTREVFYRWASFGAFSPVMRTHHGAFSSDTWQFFHDDETSAYYAAMTREHMRLFPYRYGLAARAANDGTPMILPPAFLFEGESWGRLDVWMLGDALLVAPVMAEGAEGRDVALPGAVSWVDWFSGAPATSGFQAAAIDEIPVFQAEGTIVPTFAEAPDTLLDDPVDGVTTLADVDGARVLYVHGTGGRFVEADGTTYEVSGVATPGEASSELQSGEIAVNGLTVQVTGTVSRAYRVVVR
jgi:alpha-glucosidase